MNARSHTPHGGVDHREFAEKIARLIPMVMAERRNGRMVTVASAEGLARDDYKDPGWYRPRAPWRTRGRGATASLAGAAGKAARALFPTRSQADRLELPVEMRSLYSHARRHPGDIAAFRGQYVKEVCALEFRARFAVR